MVRGAGEAGILVGVPPRHMPGRYPLLRGNPFVQRHHLAVVGRCHTAKRGPLAAFGAHSLRSGFLTSAARRGASVFKMRDVSRHKSMDVLQAYVRDADLFRHHAGAGLL
jgi:hypothetical protein